MLLLSSSGGMADIADSCWLGPLRDHMKEASGIISVDLLASPCSLFLIRSAHWS